MTGVAEVRTLREQAVLVKLRRAGFVPTERLHVSRDSAVRWTAMVPWHGTRRIAAGVTVTEPPFRIFAGTVERLFAKAVKATERAVREREAALARSEADRREDALWEAAKAA